MKASSEPAKQPSHISVRFELFMRPSFDTISHLRLPAGIVWLLTFAKMKSLILILILIASVHASAGDAMVNLHLLDHTDEKTTETRFWIDWNNTWRGIVSTETVTNEAAEEIILLLRKSLLNTEAMHFCGHDPIYGIEAIDTDGKILKTSLCFACLTWVKPGLRLDMAGERGANNELCKKLRELIELPEELLETEPTTTNPKGGGNSG